MRMYMTGRQNKTEHLTFDGAAEYYWEMLMEPAAAVNYLGLPSRHN